MDDVMLIKVEFVLMVTFLTFLLLNPFLYEYINYNAN